MKTFLLAVLPFVLGFIKAQDDELILVHVLYRHGSKIPDVLDPENSAIWEPFGLNIGDLSPLGEHELRDLGSLLRERYIENTPFLPQTYNQDTLYIRASANNPRPLQSSESLVRTLYPDAPVIIYTQDPPQDTLLLSAWNCPSYLAGLEPQSVRFYEERMLGEYAEFFANVTERTGFAGALYPDLIDFAPDVCSSSECPWTYAWLSTDGIQQTVFHGFEDTIDPYFIEHWDTLNDILAGFEEYAFGMKDDNDPRGPSFGEFAREFLVELQSAVEGTSPRKMINYSMHSILMLQLQDALGLPLYFVETGGTLIFETRRRSDGEYYIRAEYLLPVRGGEGFTSRVQPLRCSTLQEQCNLDDFMAFVGTRNAPPSHTGGCCFRTQDFYDIGCDDFLNPETLDIHECRKWREVCPQTACGPNQIVDRATLLCVQIA